MNPEQSEKLERLVVEFNPLIKSLSYKVPFKRMGFTVEDIESFFLDKLIHVYLKYHDKSWEDLKYITSTSLGNYLTKLWAKNQTVVRLDDGDLEYILPPQEEPSAIKVVEDMFFDYLKSKLRSEEFKLFMLLNFPPLYVTTKVNSFSKRIPSKLFLEFLEVPVTNQTIKKFNRLRRDIWSKVTDLGQQYKQTEGIF